MSETGKKSKKGFWVIVILAALAVVIAATMGIRYAQSLKKDIIDIRPVVSAALPETRDIEVYTEQIGNITPAEYVAVIPMLTGEVLETYFEAGDPVEEGDILCSIKSDALKSLQIQVDSSKLQLDDAKVNLERTKALYDAGAASLQNLEQLQSMVDGYQLAYDAASEQYNLQEKYSKLTAPISGIIKAKNVKPHDFAAPQNPAFIISAEDGVNVSFGINEDSAETLEIGEPVTVELDGVTYLAEVTEIGSMIGTGGLRDAKANVIDGEDLTMGSRAKVTLIKNRSYDTMAIPMKAVYHAGDSAFVYVLQDGKAVKKDFLPGIYDGEYIEVLDGISPQDRIITTWNKELYDGAEVIE